MPTTTPRPAHRRLVIGVVATLAALIWASPAGADVVATPIDADGSGLVTVAIDVDGGCGERATTSVTLRIPADLHDVTALHGVDLLASAQGDEVTWSGALADPAEVVRLQLTTRFSADDGTEVALPVTQQCGDVSLVWSDDEPDAAGPAPRVVVPDGTGGQVPPEVDPNRPAAAAVAVAPGESGALAGGAVGFMVFAGVMVTLSGGAVYLVWRSRRS